MSLPFQIPETPAQIKAALAVVEEELERRHQDSRIQHESIWLMQNFKEFVKAAWNELEPLNVFMSNWHIDAISDHLEAISKSQIRRLQILVPPGSMKSRLVSVLWPAWEWTHSPGMKYWTGSYDIRLSKELASYSRNLMRTNWYQERWGHMFTFEKTMEEWYTNDQGGHRLSTSPDSSGLGVHGHRIIIDDGVSAGDAGAVTMAMLERANAWYSDTMSGRGLPGYAEVIVMQRLHECLPPDSLVRTPSGSVPIKELRAGDEVLTSAGVQPVVEVASRNHTGKMFHVRTYGHCEPFSATHNHRVQTTRGWVAMEHLLPSDTFVFHAPPVAERGHPEWPKHEGTNRVTARQGSFTGSRGKTPARETVQALVDEGLTVQEIANRLGFKSRGSAHNALLYHGIERPSSRVTPETIMEDDDFWWFVGLWLAEGCVTKSRGHESHVRLTLHTSEVDYLDRIAKMLVRYNGTVTWSVVGNVFQASVFSKQIGKFLRQFGTNARNKHLPEWVNSLPPDHLKQMFIGYWQGDGSLSKNKAGTPSVRVGSSSLDLLEGWQRALIQFGVAASVMKGSKPHAMSIAGKTYQATQSWELRFPLCDAMWIPVFTTAALPPARRKIRIDDGQLLLPIKEIVTTDYNGDVWDIETPCHDFLSHAVTAHNSDLAAYAQQFGDWTILCLPEVFERNHPYAWHGDPRQEGDLLWPQRRDWEEHAILERKLGSKAAGQLQQRPASRSGDVLPRAMWRYYEPSAIDAAEQGDTTKLPKFTSIVCSWDTTFKDKNTSDYVAGGAWGIHGGTRFLLRSFHEKASLSRTATQMIEMRNWCLQRWPHLPVKVLIEKSANGVEIINLLKRDIPGVIPIVVSTDKMTRAEACEPDFTSESVWVPGEANVAGNDYNPAHTPQWVQEIIEESSSFPRAANDDLVDMVTMALNYVRTTRRSPARTASALRGAARQRRREGALAFRTRR